MYIVQDRRRYGGFNMEEYEEIEEKAKAIIDGFRDVTTNDKGYATYKEVMEDNAILYTSHRCHLLKEWAKYANHTIQVNCRNFLP